MISKETLRKFSVFTNLSDEQLTALWDVSYGKTVEKGQIICKNNEELDHFFLVLEGKLEVLFELPKLKVEYDSPGQPTQLQTEYVSISQIEPGQICGWSGLVPPFISTSTVRALESSTLIAFDSKKLLAFFENDCRFGFFVIQSAVQAIGKRLKAIYQHEEFEKRSEKT